MKVQWKIQSQLWFFYVPKCFLIEILRKRFCNGCSPIKVKENFTPPSSFPLFQICPDIVFLQLTFVNCIIRYTVD